MMGKKLFVLLLILQAHAVFPQQYSLRRYTVLDGLPQSSVNMVLEDCNGYLWIGTHGGGLARFDGREFKVYTTRDGLLSNIVHYLKLDSKQNLWIVHPRGVTKFDGVSFHQFKPPGPPNALRRVRRVFELKDSIFFVTSQGMTGKIHNDSIYYWNEPVRKGRVIQYTHLLPSREIALYLNDSSFLIRSPRGDRRVRHDQFNFVSHIFNVDEKVWLKTEKGYFHFNYEKGTFKPAELDVTRHVVQYDSSTHSFWTRWEDDLLKEYWVDGVHKTDTVLKDVNSITQVFVDSEGNTWLGSYTNGLYKYFIQDFDKSAPESLSAVFAINKDHEDQFWIGSGTSGLWKMGKGKAKNYKVGESNDNYVASIEISPKGDVWVGAAVGLGQYIKETDKVKWFTRMEGLPGPAISQINFDKEGKVWFCTNGAGVGVYDGEQFGSVSVEQGLPSRNAMSLRYMPYNDLVYAGTDGGVSVIKDMKATPLLIKELENTGVYSISVFREKMLLLGSGGAGVILLNVENGSKTVIDTRAGLPSDFIYFVAADEEDRLWIGTEKGITTVELDESLQISELLQFGYDNGLAGVETNMNAYYLGKSKYFGIIDGVYEYNDLRKAGWHSFDLHLTDIEIFNGDFPVRQFASETDKSFFRIPVNPQLPYDKNHITFHFNRVDKRYPKSVRYQYRLENYDKAWSISSPTNSVTYGNLPPGDYVFTAKATSNQGSWDKNVLTYPFTVEAPFYRTTAFNVIAAIFVLGIAGLYTFWRVRRRLNKIVELQRIRQHEQDSLRKEIARDFHDEMGNQLTRIINYISLMKLSKNGHTVELYNKVEDSAKYLYTGTRDFIWSIDPVNDELSKLFIHIRDFGDKLFSEKEINFRAYNEVKGNVTVPYGFSREANLIFKEAMTNSFNHSQAKNVSFTLKQEGDSFEMILEDDGRGFDTGDVDKLNGVRNMKSRADRIQSDLDVRSTENIGTTIRLIFSTNKKSLKYGISI